MNILHSISRARITPDDFVSCIEIPAGSKNKYELDKESGALILDRIL
ncbi:MAG: inorganic diphosphatase, partial [Bacilli bacterium]|nr:inorganic diphosphatase [Bacilli bacterium]